MQGKSPNDRARDSKGRFLARKPQEPEPSPTQTPTLDLLISPSASTSQPTTTPQQRPLTAPVTTPTRGQATGTIPAPKSGSSPLRATSLQPGSPTEMGRANDNGVGIGNLNANGVGIGNTTSHRAGSSTTNQNSGSGYTDPKLFHTGPSEQSNSGNPRSETEEIEPEFPPPIGNRTTQDENLITPFADALTLTPIRVKKTRPSLSPKKTPAKSKPKPRCFSEALAKKPSMPDAEYDIGTAALNFREFSFFNEDGDMSAEYIPDVHREAFHRYLSERYDVEVMTMALPFLYLECYPSAPPENERPFSIAGAICVWLEPGEWIDFSICVGERGSGKRVEVAEDLKDDLHQRRNPQKETLLSLAQSHFRDAIAISFLWDAVVVELPKMDLSQYRDLLQELPEGFANANVSLEFHNGPLPYSEHKRILKPDPTFNGPDAIADESDYVKEYGCFYPGAMIHAVDDSGENLGSVTAGILVEKGLERRLTVSYHCWESLVPKNPDMFGSPSACRIIQGDPGTEVGFMHERIKKTDVALAKLLPSIEFRNEFMEIDARPKRLLPLRQIRIGDEFLIDSFVTGRQRLGCVGLRLPLKRRQNARSHPRLKGPESLLPPDENIYIELGQGIYATNEPKIPKSPKIREGVCGAVLLRCHQRINPSRTLDSVLKDGEVAGFMHFADLQSKLGGDALLCYADSFDELASEGWEVVQAAEKRKEPSGNNEGAL
jgi:hypothetical protein